MKPMFERRSNVNSFSLNSVRSVSPMKTFPLDRLSKPAMQCIKVDFPDPEGPIIAENFPASKEISTLSNAVTSVSPLP